MSKAPEKYVNGVYPKGLISGKGAVVTDGKNEYIDFIAGLGPIILGYDHPSVTRAAVNAIKQGGPSFSLPHPCEVGLAEMLSGIYPIAEMSRFFKTGSDVLSAAVRVCRAFTGKNKVVVCGYHGWHEWYAGSTDKPAGVPESVRALVKQFKYNDIQSLKDCFTDDDVAAVILEPVVFDEPKDNFLQEVIRIAHEHDAIVVFDEVVTGFRFGLSGAAGYFNIYPDLVCFSKALGNGYPIGALCGKRDIMKTFERPDFLVSGTFGGDTVSIQAAMATIYALRDNELHNIKKLWTAGNRIKDSFNELGRMLQVDASCRGFAPRTEFIFPTIEHKALFWQECVKKGVLFGYSNFAMSAHSELITWRVIDVMEAAMRYLKEHWTDPAAVLEGEVPKSPFVKR